MIRTGLVRRLDQLGRITIPKEIRNSLNFEIGTPMEIYVNGDDIVLKVFSVKCDFCEEVDDLIDFKEKKICKKCLSDLQNK